MKAKALAIDLIDDGQCSPQCLLARSEAERCDCTCSGAWHGGLIDALAVEVVDQPHHPGKLPRCAWCGQRLKIVRDYHGNIIESEPMNISPYLEVAHLRCAFQHSIPAASGDQFNEWCNRYRSAQRAPSARHFQLIEPLLSVNPLPREALRKESFHGHITAQELDELLVDLVSAGVCAIERKETRGRPRNDIRLVTDETRPERISL